MRRYKVANDVVHETVGDEVVIIHLGSGIYYSIRGRGVQVWEAAIAGAAVAAPAFLAELESEGLIEPVDGAEPHAVGDALAVADPHPADELVLERFADMQDLLLLDPVHEVDAQGWPHPA